VAAPLASARLRGMAAIIVVAPPPVRAHRGPNISPRSRVQVIQAAALPVASPSAVPATATDAHRCEYCGSTFKKVGKLNRHKSTHTGEVRVKTDNVV
jgi:hypothetical protein